MPVCNVCGQNHPKGDCSAVSSLSDQMAQLLNEQSRITTLLQEQAMEIKYLKSDPSRIPLPPSPDARLPGMFSGATAARRDEDDATDQAFQDAAAGLGPGLPGQGAPFPEESPMGKLHYFLTSMNGINEKPVSSIAPAPHKFVRRAGALLKNISFPEYVTGMLHAIDRQKSTVLKDYWRKHLIAVSDEHQTYSWPPLRDAEMALFSDLSMGLLDWEKEQDIFQLRYRIIVASKAKVATNSGATSTTRTKKVYPPDWPNSASDMGAIGLMPCTEFNAGNCTKTGDKHGSFLHCCEYCVIHSEKCFDHAAFKCVYKNPELRYKK